jgi:hypothetical protein
MNEELKNETQNVETQTPAPVKEPKAKKSKAPAPKKTEEKESAPRYAPKGTITDPTKQTIVVLAKSNPKRPGTKCHAWFQWYKTGMTVAAYYEKGGRADHIRWDVQHGFIALKNK